MKSRIATALTLFASTALAQPSPPIATSFSIAGCQDLNCGRVNFDGSFPPTILPSDAEQLTQNFKDVVTSQFDQAGFFLPYDPAQNSTICNRSLSFTASEDSSYYPLALSALVLLTFANSSQICNYSNPFMTNIQSGFDQLKTQTEASVDAYDKDLILVGIVLGSMVGLCILFALCQYCSRDKKPLAAQDNPQYGALNNEGQRPASSGDESDDEQEAEGQVPTTGSLTA